MASLTLQRGARRPRSPRVIEYVLEWSVVAATVATVPVVYALEHGSRDAFVLAADWGLWLIFLADYAILGVLAEDRRRYLRGNWLGLAVVLISFPGLPVVLALVRLAYLLRLLRLLRLFFVIARCMHALRLALGRPGILYLTMLTAILTFAATVVLMLLEPQTLNGDFWNGIWWAMVTATTVGYGDIVPTTLAGRIVAVGLMITGAGLVATLSAAIAAYFVRQDLQLEEIRDTRDMAELRQRLERIDGALRERTEQPDLADVRARLDRIEAAIARNTVASEEKGRSS